MRLTIRKSLMLPRRRSALTPFVMLSFRILEDFDFKPARAAPARNGRATAKVYAELSDDDDDL
jgi:hypothetical protein